MNRKLAARNKSFLFLSEKAESYKVMVKLGPSLEEARVLAEARPEAWVVGKGGWVTVKLGSDERAPEGLLERWLEES